MYLYLNGYNYTYSKIYDICIWLYEKCVHVCQSVYVFVVLISTQKIYLISIYPSIYNMSIYLYIYPSIYLSIYLYVYLYVYPSIYLSIYMSIYLSSYLSIHLGKYNQ